MTPTNVEIERELEILYEFVSEEEVREEIEVLQKDLQFYKSKNILNIGDSEKKKIFLEEMERTQNTLKFLNNKIAKMKTDEY